MIVHVATGTIARGKQSEAEKRLLKLVAYRNEKIKGAPAQIERSIDGPSNRVNYVDFHDSMAAWEAARAILDADPEWNRLVADAGELMEGNVEHHFSQVIE